MDKFGKIKNKLLLKLTESYSNGDKKTIGSILKSLKTDKNFKDLYVFYENFERQYIETSELASQYVEDISKMLRDSYDIKAINKQYSKLIEGVDIDVENKLYDSLDMLTEADNILNAADKIKAKKYLVEYLTQPKEFEAPTDVIVENEHLLNFVLTNNFNLKYNEILSEDEKKELISLLALTDKEVEEQVTELKEDVVNKINNLLIENNDSSVSKKLMDVENMAIQMKPNKYNLFKLKQLRMDIN